MGMISMVVGGTTDTVARFVAKVDTGPVRIAYSTNSDMSSPSFSSSVAVDADGVAKVEVTGLTAGTRYHWQVEDNSVLDTSATGQFVTDPAAAGQPASYIVGAAGDAGLSPAVPGVSGDAPDRLSNHPVFDTIRQRAIDEGWVRLVHLGDGTYYDLGSGNHGLSSSATAAQYRDMWDDLLAQPRQHQLYREVPWVYVWDDHDFGPPNGDSSSPGRDNACTVFRERAPHYDLPAGSGANPIYRSFDIGRVLHVVFDTRADRDPGAATPTMLGAAQKTWLDALLQGTSAEALVAWMPTPWTSDAAGDTWGGFQTERDEVESIFGDNGFLSKMVMLHADVHATGIASTQEHGGFPVVLCASLDATPSSLSGPAFDLGFWGGRNQYATLEVIDKGDDVVLAPTVWRGTTPLAWAYVNTGGTSTGPAGNPSHVLAL